MRTQEQVDRHLISILRNKWKEDVHKCMLEFLILFLYDNSCCALYDGNHIISENEDMNGNYIPLEEYGLDHLIESFQDLSHSEVAVLERYFNIRNGNI